MSLTAEEKRKLDKLSFVNGGSYSDFMSDYSKMDAPDGTFLFIGLGGKGCQVVADLKAEISRKIQCSQNGMRWDHVEYLAIDSDDNELRRLCRENFGEAGSNGVLQNQEVFHLYDSMSAAVLNNPHMRPDSIKEWMNESLTIQLIGNGSGGIRQAGRSLLFGERNISTLCEVISSKLARLSTVSEKETQVYIFAGIGGGTGSGTVIDIPYIIRECAHRLGNEIKIFGYIFLPDTYNVGQNMAPQIVPNSYAALQEIDVFMELGKSSVRRFKARYSNQFCIDSTENIFDACALVDGKRETGRVPNPDRFSRKKVVNYVIAQMFSFHEPTPEDFLKGWMGMGKPIPPNMRYYFQGIGCSSVEVPVDQMMGYVAKHVLDKIAAGWNHHATQQDVDITLKRYGLDPATVGNQIMNSAIGLLKYVKDMKRGITREMARDQRWYKQMRALWMAHHNYMYMQWDIARQENISRINNNIEKDFQEKFTGSDCGIYFLRELLANRRGGGDEINGTLEQIKRDYYAQLENLINGARAGQQQEMADMYRMENGHYIFFPFDEYGEACVKRLGWGDVEYLYDHYVRKCLDVAIMDMEEKITETQKYIDILGYLKAAIDNNYQLLMCGRRSEGEGQLLDFSLDIPETQNVITYLDEMLAEKVNEELACKFSSKMWKSRMHFDPVQTFVEFLEQEFEPILELSLQDFLTIQHGPAMAKNAIQQICQKMDRESARLLTLVPQLRLQNFPSETVIIAPNDPLVVSEIQAYLSWKLDTRVIPIQGCQAIYWSEVNTIPVFTLADIQRYEEEYQKYRENSMPGIHLCETVEENWEDFPLLENDSDLLKLLSFFRNYN